MVTDSIRDRLLNLARDESGFTGNGNGTESRYRSAASRHMSFYKGKMLCIQGVKGVDMSCIIPCYHFHYTVDTPFCTYRRAIQIYLCH